MPRPSPELTKVAFRGMASLCRDIARNSGLYQAELVRRLAAGTGTNEAAAKRAWIRWGKTGDLGRKTLPTRKSIEAVVAWAKREGFLRQLSAPAAALVAWIEGP
jgi:GH24 family phage-related lysozyme (muramidase)